MIALALYAGMNPIDLKLMTAIFVLITLFITMKIAKGKARAGKKHFLKAALAAAVVIAIIAGIGYGKFGGIVPHKKTKIGVFLMRDSPILTTTRDSFLARMKELGYVDGKNAILMVENANGDMATANTIADKFIHEKVDVVVPISTNCTEIAINKMKNTPVVFATLSNPFIIGAGKSDTDHLPNVTGVYGTMSMDRGVMEVVRRIFPGPMTIGAIWDPGQVNSEYIVSPIRRSPTRPGRPASPSARAAKAIATSASAGACRRASRATMPTCCTSCAA